MNHLFRSNASRLEKVFTLAFFGWVGLSVYGIHIGFIPEPWVKHAAASLALPLALIYYIPLLLDRHPTNRLPTFGVVKRSFYYLGLLGLLYGVAWAGVFVGAPALATQLYGKEQVEELKVIHKSDGSWKRRECDDSVTVQSQQSDWRTTVCVNKEFLQAVNTGEILRATVKRSPFGGMVVKLSRQTIKNR